MCESLTLACKNPPTILSSYPNVSISLFHYIRAPPGFVNSPQNRSTIDFTEHTSRCMHQAYERKNLYELMACWSKGSSYDNFAKSADMAGWEYFNASHPLLPSDAILF